MVIIFSKDRPLQLDAVLKSFSLHCQNSMEEEITVLVKASTSGYRSAYEKLWLAYKESLRLEFIHEKDFKSDLLSAILLAEYVLFLVDDNIFVREFSFRDITAALDENPEALGFSLRLGMNTTYCYPMNKTQRLPNFIKITGPFLKYSWPGKDYDFGYPLEVSSSVYKVSDIFPFLLKLNFNNPNSFEAEMAANSEYFRKKKEYLLCPESSYTFCNPINKVQNTASDNRDGGNPEYSAEKLLELFEAGYRIDIARYSGLVPNACHQEVELKFEEDVLPAKTTCMPIVSVIIPCYNQAEYLTEAVESVVKQSYKNWECIIVNDGSLDNTSQIAHGLIEKYPQNNIKLIEKENEGLAAARNTGILNSRGKYILPLDSDDILEYIALEEMMKVTSEDEAVSLVYSDYSAFGFQKSYVQTIPVELFYNPLRQENGLAYCSFYKKEVWEKVGGYNTNMIWGYEDWDFWIGCIEKNIGTVKKISKALFRYRTKENSMITNALKHDKELRAQMIVNHAPLYKNELVNDAKKILNTSQLVSVIVPTFNRPDMLKEAVRSILLQTYRNLEILIVNDAGDDVKYIVDQLNDDRIKYITHSSNKGLAATRNTGLKKAKGKYIAYLDDDDVYYPDHIETLLTCLHEGKAHVAYTDAYRAHQQKNADKYIITHKDIPYSFDFDYDRILWGNFIPVLCIMHEKNCLKEVGMFDEKLLSHEDWDLWIRMSRKYEFKHVKKCTCEFRWRTDGSTMTSSKEEEYLETTSNIYKKYNQFSQNKTNVLAEQQKTIEWRKSLVVNKNASINNNAPLVSIIIPVSNKLEFTSHCLKSIKATVPASIKYEIIVVDNASTDGTRDFLKGFDGPVKTVLNDVNNSFSKANNQGAAIAKGKYLLFLNNDTQPLKGWLENIIREFEGSRNVAVQGARLLYHNGKIQHAGMVFGERGGRPAEPYHIYLMHEADAPHVNKKRTMQFVTGACLAIRKEVFDEVGGFDEKYVFGWEDTDLCMKVNEAGYKILYNPEVLLYHYESVTKKFVEASGTKIMHDDAPNEKKNRQHFFKKWGKTLVCDADQFYAMDGYKLVGNRLVEIEGRAAPEESVKTSFAHFFWQRDYDKAKNVLIKGTDAVGDNLYLTSVVASIKAKHPHLDVYIMGNKVSAKIFENNTTIKGIVSGSEKIIYDVVVDYNNIIARLPEYYNGIGLLEIFGNIAGVKLSRKSIEYSITEAELSRAQEAVSGIKNSSKLLVGIQLNTSKDIKRSYPNGQELVKVLRQTRKDISFVVLGTDTLGVNDELIFDCAAKGIALREQIAIASMCDAFITIDSAFFHLAHNLFNKPTLVITGPTNPYLIGNQEAQFSYVSNSKLKCQCCYWQKDCKTECMGQLSALSISDAFFSMLAGKNKRKSAATSLLRLSKDEDYQKQIMIALRRKKNDEKVVIHDPDKILPEFAGEWNGAEVRPNITWEGSQFVRHSLALVNREMSLRLADGGFNLSLAPYEADQYTPPATDPHARLKNYVKRDNGLSDIHVRHQWPPNLTAPEKGRWVIIQPWEFGSLPEKWVEVFSHQVDEMWVPSNYVRDVYISSGVPAERVAVIPNGFDEKKFNPKVKPYKLNTKKKFRFLFVGGTIYRKGIDILLETYVKTFRNSDDVCLVIKDMGGESFYKGQTFKEKIAEIKKEKNAPEIEYIDKMLSDKELAGLYTACQVLVHPYRGEGFGLPILEAMASGTPAIVTNGGACLDFCSQSNSILVNADKKYISEKKVGDLATVSFPWFYEVRPDELAEKMKYALDNPKAVKELGKKASEFVLSNFTWDKAFEKLQARIEAIASKPVIRENKVNTSEAPANKDKKFIIKRISKGTEFEVITCPFCSSKDAEQYRISADIVKCRNCSTVYLRTRMTQEKMRDLYQTYADGSSHMRLPENMRDVENSVLRRTWFMEEILAMVKFKGNMLDVGCGWGAFLDCGRSSGFNPRGVELTAKCVDYANKELEIPVTSQQFIETEFHYNSFALVTMNHVLEHIPEPKQTLNYIYNILKPEGMFCGIVPNIESLSSNALKDRWEWIDANYHYVHYSPATLRMHLESAGFIVEKIYTKTGDFGETVPRKILEKLNPAASSEEIEQKLQEVENNGRGEEIRFFARKPLMPANNHNTNSGDSLLETVDELIVKAYNSFENEEYEDAGKLIEAACQKISLGEPAVEFTLDEVFQLQGTIGLLSNDIEKARAAFENALQENPQSSEACLGLGTIFYQSGMAEEAKVMLEWAAKNDPQNENAKNSLAKVNLELGYDEYHSSLNEVTENYEAAENPEVNEFESEFTLAYQYFTEQNYQDALLKLYEAEMVYDETLAAQSSIVLEDASVLRGSIYLILNEDNKARISFERALNLNPESSEACHGLAEIFFRADMFEEARTMFEWALKNNPGNESAIQRLNTIAGILGQIPENSSADDNPSKKEVESAISEAYELYQNRQFNDSISKLLLAGDLLDDLEHEAERNEFTSVIENMKGMNYLGVKKVDKAKASFSRALELNPQSSQACAGLGEVFYLCEMDKEAKTMYEWALKNDETNQFALSGLKKVNQLLGYEDSDNSLLN